MTNRNRLINAMRAAGLSGFQRLFALAIYDGYSPARAYQYVNYVAVAVRN